MRTFCVVLMLENDAAHPSSLTPVQIAFLASLLPGPRQTGDCQDAITVGGLLRLNLVAWDEPDHRLKVRRRHGTFALSEAGIRALDSHLPNS
jgi:hypothetical protein